MGIEKGGDRMSDLIRRGDALKALLKVPCKIDSDNYAWIRLSDAFGTVDEDVPSAEPERKRGEWIPVESQTVNGRCSVCGYESHLYENDVYGEHFCPNCGADLRGE